MSEYQHKNNKSSIPYSSDDADSYTYVDGKGFTPSPPIITERRLLQWSSNGIGFAIIFYIIFSLTLPNTAVSVIKLFNPYLRITEEGFIANPIISQIAEILVGNISLLLPFAFLIFIHKAPTNKILPFKHFQSSITVPALFIAMGTSVIGAVSSVALSIFMSLFGYMPIMGNFEMPQNAVAAALFVLNVAIIAPISEEIVFRGAIMNILRRFGDCFALLISSLLFSLVHMNLVQIPNAFLMGLVIGYFTLCTGSLWTGICIHCLNNSLVLLVNGILELVPPEFHNLITLIIYIGYLTAGIIAFLFLLRRHPNIFFFHRSATLSTEKKKYSAFFSALTMTACIVILFIFTINNIVKI